MCLSILASHLGGLFHHKPALVAPLFLWVGYFLCAHHTHFHFPTFMHTGTPTLANPAPTQALCPPVHPSVHLCAPCAPFFPGFFLHPLHFLCPGTLPSLSHGPWVGKFFLLGKTLAVIPRGLQGLSPKGGIGVLGSAYIQIHYSVSSTTNTGPSLQCYPTPVVITSGPLVHRSTCQLIVAFHHLQ